MEDFNIDGIYSFNPTYIGSHGGGGPHDGGLQGVQVQAGGHQVLHQVSRLEVIMG